MTAPAAQSGRLDPIPAARYADRLERAAIHLEGSGAALVLGVGADLRYLTGYTGHPSERPTLLVLTPGGSPSILAPRLEAMAVAECPAARGGLVEVLAWDETEDPYALAASRVPASASGARVLVDPTLASRHVLGLQHRLEGRAWGLAAEVTNELRIRKDEEEIERLRRAAHAADRVIERVSRGPLVGRSEIEVSREVRDRLVDEGHDESSFAIVAAGENGASPHHSPTDRAIRAGEGLVLDIGGTLDGYGSDITRTIWVSGSDGGAQPDETFRSVYELVRAAQAASATAVRPGIACGALDAVAREVIREGGYGEAFIHRLGHGIGLEGHEEPYLVAGNDLPLEPRMTFSLEPGIYLAGRFGVRIEDIACCRDDGAEILNEAPRELLVVSG